MARTFAQALEDSHIFGWNAGLSNTSTNVFAEPIYDFYLTLKDLRGCFFGKITLGTAEESKSGRFWLKFEAAQKALTTTRPPDAYLLHTDLLA